MQTRLLQEYSYHLKEPFIALLITFQNGSHRQLQELENPEFAFALRLLYRYFLHDNCKLKWPKFLEKAFKEYQPITIADAITMIIDHYKTRVNRNEKITIYIAIDEFTRISGIESACKIKGCGTQNYSGLDYHDYLRHIMEALNSLQVDFKDLTLLPVYAGTYSDTIRKVAMASGLRLEYVNLSFISSSSLLDKVLDKEIEYISTKITTPSSILEVPEFRYHITIFGGIIQYMANYLMALWDQLLFLRDLTSWKKLDFIGTFGNVKNHYPRAEKPDFFALAYFVLQEPIPAEHKRKYTSTLNFFLHQITSVFL